jgi:hypothetical protein
MSYLEIHDYQSSPVAPWTPAKRSQGQRSGTEELGRNYSKWPAGAPSAFPALLKARHTSSPRVPGFRFWMRARSHKPKRGDRVCFTWIADKQGNWRRLNGYCSEALSRF